MTLDLDTLVLRSGTHTSSSDGVSLMEAVSALAGEPWSNSPSCTSPVIAAYARSLNDWLPDDARQRLKAYIPRLVGTAEPDLELRRAFACADAAVRVFAPLAFAAAGLVEEAAKLGALAPVDRESAESARSAAESAEWAASRQSRRGRRSRCGRRRDRRCGRQSGRRRRRRDRRRLSSSIASSRPPHDRRHQVRRVRGHRREDGRGTVGATRAASRHACYGGQSAADGGG